MGCRPFDRSSTVPTSRGLESPSQHAMQGIFVRGMIPCCRDTGISENKVNMWRCLDCDLVISIYSIETSLAVKRSKEHTC
jgi:hypothetical protein